MTFIWYLLVFAPFIVIPFLWWNYRRKQKARERAAEERWKEMLSKPARTGAEASVAATAPVSIATVASAASPAAAAAANSVTASSYRLQARVLDQSATLTYYLLRTGLPEYEVLIRVGLDRLLTPSADGDRERRLRGLSQHAVDFLICDKAMRPMVAVDILDVEAPAALTAAPDFKTQCLAHTGIRYVRIPRNALPKRQDVRAVVLGSAAPD